MDLLPVILAAGSWLWPLSGPIATPFQAPSHAFGAGHRGIDIVAEAGADVRASHGGSISFVGPVGGVPTVSVQWGSVVSTYQPVEPLVEEGQVVVSGEVLGRLGQRHGECTCLHFGVRVSGDYRDPRSFLPRGAVLKSPRRT